MDPCQYIKKYCPLRFIKLNEIFSAITSEASIFKDKQMYFPNDVEYGLFMNSQSPPWKGFMCR